MGKLGHATILAVVVLTVAVMAVPSAGEPGRHGRSRFDLRLFTRIGEPGSPEPVAVGADGRVYVGTNAGGRHGPSRIFAFSRRGALLRTYVIRGQNLDEGHGIQGIAFDGRGRLFALDRAADPRVIVIDPVSGSQHTYSRFRDVPSCAAAGRSTNCSDTQGDDVAGPDYAAFGPGGALYVSDISQALIWRVPRGGGRPGVWLTDPRFEDSILGFGPNGFQFVDGGHTLRLAVTITAPSQGDPPVSGALFDIPLRGAKRLPGHLETFWRSRTADGPDGFAVGRSGTVYLIASAANRIVIISRRGEEERRIPATPEENASMDVPLDSPASAVFSGKRVLITNQSLAGNPSNWAVLDLYAGERGLPLFRPMLGPRR